MGRCCIIIYYYEYKYTYIRHSSRAIAWKIITHSQTPIFSVANLAIIAMIISMIVNIFIEYMSTKQTLYIYIYVNTLRETNCRSICRFPRWIITSNTLNAIFWVILSQHQIHYYWLCHVKMAIYIYTFICIYDRLVSLYFMFC